jgi:hypothetical protein
MLDKYAAGLGKTSEVPAIPIRTGIKLSAFEGTLFRSMVFA